MRVDIGGNGDTVVAVHLSTWVCGWLSVIGEREIGFCESERGLGVSERMRKSEGRRVWCHVADGRNGN